MKKFAAILAVAPFALSAQAALATPFSGPYFGAEVSYDSYEVQADSVDVGGYTISADGLSGNGVSGGLYAGYDMAIGTGAFVGVEAAFDYSGASISASGTDGVDTLSASVKARETYSIAGRFGLKFAQSAGAYVKLGYANTRFKTEAFANSTSLFSDSRAKGAFVYGAGLQTAVADNMSLRAEFTISDYGSAGLDDDLGVNGIKVRNAKSSVGLSYHF